MRREIVPAAHGTRHLIKAESPDDVARIETVLPILANDLNVLHISPLGDRGIIVLMNRAKLPTTASTILGLA